MRALPDMYALCQANMSAATGCIIYAYLKCSIIGQQLLCSGYDKRTYPRDIKENFGYATLMFLSVLLIIYGKITKFTKGLDR